MNSRYPDNWNEIATALKIKEQWRCYRCGIKCIQQRPINGFKDIKKRVYLLQVHHWDRSPENNDSSNLVCVCTKCHLQLHRYCGSMTPGQLSLFDLSFWHVVSPRATPMTETPLQLKIPVIKTQLKLMV